jgi:hypothetical protein
MPAASRGQRFVLAIGSGAALTVVAAVASALIERLRPTAITVGTNVSGYKPIGQTVVVGHPGGAWWAYVGLVWLAAAVLWMAVAHRLFRAE